MWKQSKQGVDINIYLPSKCDQESILKLNFKESVKVIKQLAACKLL